MKMVLKYPIALDSQASGLPVGVVIPVKMHLAAHPVHAAMQFDTLCVWAQVPKKNVVVADDGDVLVTRKFCIYGTGWDIPSPSYYIGTVQRGEFVWHLYEVLE
jgi:hypothetical protein